MEEISHYRKYLCQIKMIKYICFDYIVVEGFLKPWEKKFKYFMDQDGQFFSVYFHEKIRRNFWLFPMTAWWFLIISNNCAFLAFSFFYIHSMMFVVRNMWFMAGYKLSSDLRPKQPKLVSHIAFSGTWMWNHSLETCFSKCMMGTKNIWVWLHSLNWLKKNRSLLFYAFKNFIGRQKYALFRFVRVCVVLHFKLSVHCAICGIQSTDVIDHDGRLIGCVRFALFDGSDGSELSNSVLLFLNLVWHIIPTFPDHIIYSNET